nr:hypothetical protein OG999_48955 [Streptomyces sp. NBC_00886]
MADTSTPLHLFENGANPWVDSAAWPLSSDARASYLGDGSLSADKPTARGSDTLSWRTATASNTLTHTTEPLDKAALLDGPTDVTLCAGSTTPETELTAKLSIVAPDGTVTKQADGVVYTIDCSPQAASFVNLPLTTPSSATRSGDDWGRSS